MRARATLRVVRWGAAPDRLAATPLSAVVLSHSFQTELHGYTSSTASATAGAVAILPFASPLKFIPHSLISQWNWSEDRRGPYSLHIPTP